MNYPFSEKEIEKIKEDIHKIEFREIKKINAQIDDFSNKTGMNKEESLKLLTRAAKYYNDKDTQMNTPALNEEQIEAGYISTTKYTKAQIDEAYNYLISSSKGLYFTDVYKESMINQKMFTSTQEQFNNSDYNPNSSIGLEDSSLTFVPTVKVGVTTIKAGVEVAPNVFNGGKVVNKLDNLNTNLGIQSQNIINQSLPKLENTYYNSKVFIYNPENVLKGVTLLDIVNGAYSPDPPSTVTQSLGFSIKRFIIDQDFSSPFINPNKKDENE